jgi:hypothetical protein
MECTHIVMTAWCYSNLSTVRMRNLHRIMDGGVGPRTLPRPLPAPANYLAPRTPTLLLRPIPPAAY